MNPTIVLVLAVVGVLVVVGGGLAVLIASFYRKVDQGRALIVNKMTAEPVVTFTGSVVYPIIHRAEEMDISVKTIEVARRGPDGLICKDNLRADIQVTFFVRVNKTSEDVLKVAQSGRLRSSASGPGHPGGALPGAKFSEALKTVGKSAGVRRAVRPSAPRLQVTRSSRTIRPRPQRLRARRRRDRLPRADPAGDTWTSPEHPGRAGHPKDHRADHGCRTFRQTS